MDFNINTNLDCHQLNLDSNLQQREKLIPHRIKRNLVGVNTKQSLQLINLDLKLINPNLNLSSPLKKLKLHNLELQGNILQTECDVGNELLSNVAISCKKPRLFNKELMPKASGSLKPSLFLDNLLSTNESKFELANSQDQSLYLVNKNLESSEKNLLGKKSLENKSFEKKSLEKRSLEKKSLEKKHLERKDSGRREKKLKRKRKKVKGNVVNNKLEKVANVDAPVYGIEFDVNIKLELEEIRNKIKSGTSDLFVENKDESDLKKLEKEKIDKKKVKFQFCLCYFSMIYASPKKFDQRIQSFSYLGLLSFL